MQRTLTSEEIKQFEKDLSEAVARKKGEETTKLRGITMSWLSKVWLEVNPKAGCGAYVEFMNCSEGYRPYVPEQWIYTGIRETIIRNYSELFRCVPEAMCGNIEKCWLCDIFRYSNEDIHLYIRRRSPLKVRPAIGQIPFDIHGLFGKFVDKSELPDRCDSASPLEEYVKFIIEQSTDLEDCPVENIFETGISLDIANIGREFGIFGEDERGNYNFRVMADIGEEERKRRAIMVLESVIDLVDLGVDLQPVTFYLQVFLAGLHPQGSRFAIPSLGLDSEGNIDPDKLRLVLRNMKNDGVRFFMEYHPGVVANDDDLLGVMNEFGLKPAEPYEVMKSLIEAIQEAEIG